MAAEPKEQNESLLPTQENSFSPNGLQWFGSPVDMNAFPSWEEFDSSSLETRDLGLSQTDKRFDPLTSFAESNPFNESSNNAALGEVSDNTTLCSLAFSLVLKNNRKGYSTTDLDIRLRVGYRLGETILEGCRIDNKILFSVLAEIS